jgi:hypothetical protein
MRGVWHVWTVGQAGKLHRALFVAQCVGFAVVADQLPSYAIAMTDTAIETALCAQMGTKTEPLGLTGDCLDEAQQFPEPGFRIGGALCQ